MKPNSAVVGYHKSSNYSAKKFNSNLQLVLLLEPKNTSKVASGAYIRVALSK